MIADQPPTGHRTQSPNNYRTFFSSLERWSSADAEILGGLEVLREAIFDSKCEVRRQAIYCDTICWFVIRFWKPRKLLPDTEIIPQVVAKIPKYRRVTNRKCSYSQPSTPKTNTEEPLMACWFLFCRPELSARSPRKVWPMGIGLVLRY